jgi:hypothetical protein
LGIAAAALVHLAVTVVVQTVPAYLRGRFAAGTAGVQQTLVGLPVAVVVQTVANVVLRRLLTHARPVFLVFSAKHDARMADPHPVGVDVAGVTFPAISQRAAAIRLVYLTVAVIVDPVVTGLGRTRTHQAIFVVAIGAQRAIPPVTVPVVVDACTPVRPGVLLLVRMAPAVFTMLAPGTIPVILARVLAVAGHAPGAGGAIIGGGAHHATHSVGAAHPLGTVLVPGAAYEPGCTRVRAGPQGGE